MILPDKKDEVISIKEKVFIDLIIKLPKELYLMINHLKSRKLQSF
jgi:hypothetical protein